jgi:solute carrier family 25, member 39/40
VVRVRLQSQQNPSTSTSLPRTNPVSLPVTQFRDLPPNLGISTCCREVFWINNNAQFCVAGPTIAPTTPSASTIACAAEETRSRHITSTLDGLQKIARNEGPRTLWRGLSPTLLMAIPANVIYFAGYDWLRNSPKAPFQGLIPDSTIPLAAGSTARILAAIAVSPIEMFRTRMQATQSASATGHFRETLNGMQEMIRSQGIFSMWRGLTLTMWRDVPFSAIYWWGYESGRNWLADIRDERRARRDGRDFSSDPSSKKRRRSESRSNANHTATLVDSFIAGATSGAFAALITTPFDVGKTRQQVVRHAGDDAKPASTVATDAIKKTLRPEELSMPRFLWHIFKEQGMPGLFKGWAARCLKVAPACAIMISSYEIGKKMAGDANERREH